ncbi:MAG: HDIG domain-containing protein [Muribaculaceae bacterium]|nr:HDIG domain-containing protein [Muribaculaceae bacterium]
MDYQKIIDKYYPVGTTRRDIYMHHCRQVADKALTIARTKKLDLDKNLIEAAAMLHDIGIVMTDAPSIDCHGSLPYICHGIAGADLLRKEGYPEEVARVAERHTGAGISDEDITELDLPLPPGNYMPETLLERLVCYADKFYSKSGEMKEKSLEKVRDSMSRHSSATLDRFEKLHNEFS